MGRFGKFVAIGSAVVAGPLLATTAVAIRDVGSQPASTENTFSIDSVFVSPTSGDECIGADWCPTYYPPWTDCQPGDQWCIDTRYGGGGGGGQSSGGGGGGSDDPPADYLPIGGRQCERDEMSTRVAMGILQATSQTARQLISEAQARGVTITLAAIDPTAAGGQRIEYSQGSNSIIFDPTIYVYGTNHNQTPYELTPIMLLAHELIHAAHGNDPAYQGEASEALVMQISNQIALEINAATPNDFADFNTNRDNHIRDGQGYTTSITAGSVSFSIARPSCNPYM